jgi:hypothetical protein
MRTDEPGAAEDEQGERRPGTENGVVPQRREQGGTEGKYARVL